MRLNFLLLEIKFGDVMKKYFNLLDHNYGGLLSIFPKLYDNENPNCKAGTK